MSPGGRKLVRISEAAVITLRMRLLKISLRPDRPLYTGENMSARIKKRSDPGLVSCPLTERRLQICTYQTSHRVQAANFAS